jgi:hypothetical protein
MGRMERGCDMRDNLLCSSYHSLAFDSESRLAAINLALELLKPIDFTHFAVRGVSGLIMAPTIADLMDKKIIVVRKPGESSHAAMNVEGITRSSLMKIVILDDFICSETTIRDIVGAILNLHTTRIRIEPVPSPEFVGIYLYNNYDSERSRVRDFPFEIGGLNIPFLSDILPFE